MTGKSCVHMSRKKGVWRCRLLVPGGVQGPQKGWTDGVNSSILVLVFNMALQKQFVLFTLKFPEKLKHPWVPIFHIYFRTMSCALLCTVWVKLLVPLKHTWMGSQCLWSLYPGLRLTLGVSRVPLWLGISNIESYNLSGTAQGAWLI